MESLKGTQTEKNILTAFAGESQARNRYVYFASKAKKEGYVQISNVFQETAANEKEHAERLFKFLEGGEAEIGNGDLIGRGLQSSPEIMVRVVDGEVTVRPLAGTRRRSGDEAEDQRLAEELLADPEIRKAYMGTLE